MKLSYIMQALVDLNDGENIEYETTFITAANLALDHISRIVPEERTAYITAVAPVVAFLGDVDTSGVYRAEGIRAIALRATGRGKLLVNGEQAAAWRSLGKYTDVRVYLDEATDVELKFDGISGAVKDMALWQFDYGSVDDIPVYGHTVRYDMRRIAPDYGGHVCTPIDVATGREVRRCVIDSPYIMLPPAYVGEASVIYRHKPLHITLDDVENDVDIDIAPEYEDLVPLGMSYYVWLEDEPDKAKFFLARFNEAAALARQARRRPGGDTVISYNGW